MICCGVLTIIISIILLCFRNLARKSPFNYILLFIFTIAEAYMVSYICGAIDDPELVLMATLMTAVYYRFLLFSFFLGDNYSINCLCMLY